MKMADRVWSLYNSHENSRFDSLSTAQARVIVLAIRPTSNLGRWLAWRGGDPEWRPLTEFPELLPADFVPVGVSEDAPVEDWRSISAPVSSDMIQGAVKVGSEASPSTDALDETNESSIPVNSRTEISRIVADDDGSVASIEVHLGFDEDLRSSVDYGSSSDFVSATTDEANTGSAIDEAQDFGGLGKPVKGPGREDTLPGVVVRIFDIDPALLGDFSAELDLEERIDRRKVSRYKSKLNAMVDVGGVSIPIPAKTFDAGIGGFRLEAALPSLSNKRIRVLLSRGRESVEAYCEGIAEPDGSIIRFKFLSVDRIDLLRSWLLVPRA